MTKRSRTILFIICLLLFSIIVPFSLLHSQGWRFSFGNGKFVRTGALFLKITPKSADIYINEELKKKAGIFSGSVYFENLLPGKYQLKVEKDGFFSWEKTLEVKEMQVTETKNIFLVPEKNLFSLILGPLDDIFLSTNGKVAILKESDKNGWILKTYYFENDVKNHLISQKEIANYKSTLTGITWSLDSKKILLELAAGEQQKYFVLNMEEFSPAPISLDFLGKSADKITFNPGNSQKLFFIKQPTSTNALYEADILVKEISSPIVQNIVSFAVSKDTIFYLNQQGYVSKLNYNQGKTEILNLTPFYLEQETDYKITEASPHLLLTAGSVIYFFDEESKEFIKLADSGTNLKISPDRKKIAYSDGYELWTAFLDIEYSQPQRLIGDTIFLTRFSDKIGNIFWLTPNYLIFEVGGKIKITEIDDRDKLNIYDVGKFEKPKLFWDKTSKKMYIIENNSLFSSDRLY